MKIYFRADGNAKNGAGHLMRCLSIAEAMSGEEQALFLCADEASAEFVRCRGKEAVCLHTDYSNMEEELPVLQNLWTEDEERSILVDSYYVTDAYLETLRSYGTVFLMDDLQEHAYPVDAVINYNLYAKTALYQKLYQRQDKMPRFYLGGAYIPLRKQFCGKPASLEKRVRRVLLTTGGGDVDNIAGAILDEIYCPNLEFQVLVGRFSPHLKGWKARGERQPNVHVLFDIQDMASLMKQCDLAITAGGSTVYELAAAGIPFICFAYARNQEALVKCIGEKKLSLSAGNWHLEEEAVRKRIAILVRRMCEEENLRRRCVSNMCGVVDGKGAERLANLLGKEQDGEQIRAKQEENFI